MIGLEAVIDNTDGSIWAVDTQYRLVAGNARYLGNVNAALGRKLEKGESVLLSAFPPEALAEWRGYYDRALTGEQFSVEVATRFAHPPCLVEYRVSPIRAEDGTITGVAVFGRDITARKRSEELIQAQRDVARLIGSGMARTEAWQVCLDAARRVSGMDCGLIHVFNGDDGTLELVCSYGLDDAYMRGMARVAHDDPSVQIVLTGKAHYFGAEMTRAMQPDHGELHSIAIVPIRYQGETIGTLSVGSRTQTEIARHVRQALETIAVEVGNFAVYLRTQDALRASEEKYRSLVEASEGAIVVVDGDGRIFYANAQAAALAGGTAEGISGKLMHEVEPQATADAYLVQARARSWPATRGSCSKSCATARGTAAVSSRSAMPRARRSWRCLAPPTSRN